MKAKETMLYVLDRLNPKDTFQILSFSNATEKLFFEPMPPSKQAIWEAKRYIASLEANGGTEMKHAVEEATQAPAPKNRLRIFTIMTDGLIGNDSDIVALVRKTRGVSRWFAFGTGNSVNRRLIDGVAKAGGGEAQYVLLNSPGEQIAKEFFDRISTPVLSDIKVTFQNIKAVDVLPAVLDDVWANRPLYIIGKYKSPEKGSVTISGLSGGKPYTQKVALDLPDFNDANAVLPSIWARAKVDELSESEKFDNVPTDSKKEQQEQIEDLGLKYGLLTKYTSFVAVDENGKTVEPSKKSLTVGVEAPDGMDLNGIFGQPGRGRQMRPMMMMMQSHLQGGGMDTNMARTMPRVQASEASPGTIAGAPTYKSAITSLDAMMRSTADGTKGLNATTDKPVDERHYTSGRQLQNGTQAPYQQANAYSTLHKRSNRPGSPATTIIVSTLGMPPLKPSESEQQFAAKLSGDLKKILRNPESSQKQVLIRIKFKGNRESFVEKLKALNLVTETETENQNDAKVGTLVINLIAARINELLPLQEIESLSVFTKRD